MISWCTYSQRNVDLQLKWMWRQSSTSLTETLWFWLPERTNKTDLVYNQYFLHWWLIFLHSYYEYKSKHIQLENDLSSKRVCHTYLLPLCDFRSWYYFAKMFLCATILWKLLAEFSFVKNEQHLQSFSKIKKNYLSLPATFLKDKLVIFNNNLLSRSIE